jgi:hypothetical protein
MLSVNRRVFDPSVSGEIMSRASGKFSAALKSSRGQCLPIDFSKWRLVYFGAVEAPLPLVLLGGGRSSFLDIVWYKTTTFEINKELLYKNGHFLLNNNHLNSIKKLPT